MQGRICLITGGNSGIGKATALGLAGLNAEVILVGRDKKKCEEAVEEIKRKSNNTAIDFLIADLSSMDSVRKLAKDFKKKYKQLDVLVLNAGAYFTKRKETVDGYEMTTALNFLSRFLLSNLLLSMIKKSTSARIISVIGSHQAKEIDFDDFMIKNNYKARHALARSTFTNLVFLQELGRKLNNGNVSAFCVDPGFVRTNFVEKDQDMSGMLKFIFKFFKPFGKSPEKAAETILFVATTPNLKNSNGSYFADMKEIAPSPESQEEKLAKMLWKTASKLVKK